MQEPTSFGSVDDLPAARRSGWRVQRWVDLVAGCFFTVLAVVLAWLPDAAPGLGRWIAVLFVGALGIEACMAALRNRRSLISRIGALP